MTSPFDPSYNCIAWSAGQTADWWWPVGYSRPVHWPAEAPREVTLAAFVAAFITLGYTIATNEDSELEIEKVAIFVDANEIPTHAARQLVTGRWTSKLGAGEDIEHALRDLEGDNYGTVAVVLARPRAVSSPGQPGTSA